MSHRVKDNRETQLHGSPAGEDMTSMPSLHFNRSVESIETTGHRHPTSPASSSRNTAGGPPSLRSRNSKPGRQPPRSAPGLLDAKQRCLVSSHEDKTIHRTTKVLAIAHKLSDDKVFNMRADDKPSHGSPLRSDALASLTMAGRLDLDGHGSNTSFAGLNAKATADMLVNAGLKRVGVVKFYGCGKGDPSFLAAVKDRLAEKDVEVGYLAGFKREMMEARYPVKLFGKRFNVNPMALFGFPGSAPYANP
jgi:hypothetical protein